MNFKNKKLLYTLIILWIIIFVFIIYNNRSRWICMIGWWIRKTLVSWCADKCSFKRESVLCGAVETEWCDCWPDMCWNWNNCEKN